MARAQSNQRSGDREKVRREGYSFDLDKVFTAATKTNVAMERNAYPERLDPARPASVHGEQKGVKFIINTDSPHTSHLEKIHYGVLPKVS